jgi:hypothetical protein
VRFNDDANIEAANRQYVYYLRATGVVAGDGSNNFNPKTGATKAMLAFLLYRLLDELPVMQKNQAPLEEMVEGVVERVYPAFRAVLISNATDGSRIYPVTSNAEIKINGRAAAFDDITEGMEVAVVVRLEGIVLIDVARRTHTADSVPDVTDNTNTQTILQTFEGVIVSTAENIIEVELRLLTLRGEIYNERRSFNVPAASVVFRNGVPAKITDAKAGDAVVLRVGAGGLVRSVDITEQFRVLGGVILTKRVLNADSVALTVADSITQRVFEVTASADTLVLRNGSSARYTGLRVGDAFTATLEYDAVVNIAAVGQKTSVVGWVDEVVVSVRDSRITIVDDKGVKHTYSANSASLSGPIADIYAVRVGDHVSLRLDSREVEGISVLSLAVNEGSMLGYIVQASAFTVIVSRDGTSFGSASQFMINPETIIINARTGLTVNSNALTTGARVYVVYQQTNTALAKTVTILEN